MSSFFDSLESHYFFFFFAFHNFDFTSCIYCSPTRTLTASVDLI